LSIGKTILYVVIGIAGITVGVMCVQLIWRAIGVYLIRRAGPRPLAASKHVLWRDPGDTEHLDMSDGPGGSNGAPTAPFTFVE